MRLYTYICLLFLILNYLNLYINTHMTKRSINVIKLNHQNLRSYWNSLAYTVERNRLVPLGARILIFLWRHKRNLTNNAGEGEEKGEENRPMTSGIKFTKDTSYKEMEDLFEPVLNIQTFIYPHPHPLFLFSPQLCSK
jgi:hypothetical protein